MVSGAFNDQQEMGSSVCCSSWPYLRALFFGWMMFVLLEGKQMLKLGGIDYSIIWTHIELKLPKILSSMCNFTLFIDLNV